MDWGAAEMDASKALQVVRLATSDSIDGIEFHKALNRTVFELIVSRRLC